MPTMVDEIISATQAMEAIHQAEKESEYQDKVDAALERAKQALGEVWAELEPFSVLDHRKDCINVEFYPDALSLAPFYVKSWFDKRQIYFTIGTESYYDLAKALARARELYPDWKKRKIGEKAQNFNRLIANSWDAEEVRALAASWARLDDQMDAARKALKQRLEQIEYNERLKAKREAEAAASKVEGERYAAAFKAYVQEQHAINEHNEALYHELQEQLNTPFEVWELTYAVVASDEDGQHYLDFRKVFVNNDLPDLNGYYWVITPGGQINAIRFFHMVSVQKLLVTPVICQTAAQHFDFGDWDVYAAPGEAVSATIETYREMLTPNIERPAWDKSLGDWDAERIRRNVYAQCY